MAKKIIAALTDSTLFLRNGSPIRSAPAPSRPVRRNSQTAMARWLPSDPESFVLELGPGTGAVTEALLKRGLREDRLVAIEHNPKHGADCCAKNFRARTSSPATPGNWTICCATGANRLKTSARSFPACRC